MAALSDRPSMYFILISRSWAQTKSGPVASVGSEFFIFHIKQTTHVIKRTSTPATPTKHWDIGFRFCPILFVNSRFFFLSLSLFLSNSLSHKFLVSFFIFLLCLWVILIISLVLTILKTRVCVCVFASKFVHFATFVSPIFLLLFASFLCRIRRSSVSSNQTPALFFQQQ